MFTATFFPIHRAYHPRVLGRGGNEADPTRPFQTAVTASQSRSPPPDRAMWRPSLMAHALSG